MKVLHILSILLIFQLVLPKYLLIKLTPNSNGHHKPKEIENDSEENLLNSMPKSIQLSYETEPNMNYQKPSWKPQKPKTKKPKSDQQRYDMPQVLNP